MNSSADPPLAAHHDTSTDIDCIQFTFYAYVIFFGNMCAFGLVGNGLSWAVLRWDRRSSGRVATFLLQTMAVVDNLFLLTAGISHITTAVTLYIDATNGLAPPTSSHNLSVTTPIFVDVSDNDVLALPPSAENHSLTTPISVYASDDNNGQIPPISADDLPLTTPISAHAPPTPGPGYSNVTAPPVGGVSSAVVRAYITSYVTVCVWPLVHITQMWAVWITVLVAFNRYVAICLPFQAHRLCTMRQVRCQMAGLGLSIILYNIPRWLEYKVIYTRQSVNSRHFIIII